MVEQYGGWRPGSRIQVDRVTSLVASIPHAVNRFGAYDLEEGTAAVDLTGALGEMGYEVGSRELTSGLHLIAIGDDLQGGADPRREGNAYGQ